MKSASQAGLRGQTVDTPWSSIGPSVALYPEILDRTAAPYVASSGAYLDQHCNEFTGDFKVLCGDFVELASPTGLSDEHGDLTSAFFGSDRAGGVVNAIGRAAADKSTLWAATTTGGVLVSKNADDISNVAGADGSDVTYTRIDSTSAAAPNRVPTYIYVDPKNPNRAWISYSGYSAGTPTTPGHIFEARFNPNSGTATFTSIDGSLGDMPITSIVRHDPTGDFYASNDFGALRLPREAPLGRRRVLECRWSRSAPSQSPPRGGCSMPRPMGVVATCCNFPRTKRA